MEKRFYIEYRKSGSLMNVNSVAIASEDGSYGIKEKNSGTVVAAAFSQSVSNPSTGIYETFFEVTEGTIYIVAWKIKETSSSSFTYVTQEVGPFFSSNGIRAVSDYKGTFKQGEVATLLFKITDYDSIPKTADSITLDIYKPDGTELVTGIIPEMVHAGFYVYEWSVSSANDTGTHELIWRYEIDGTSYEETQNVTIAEDSDDATLYSGKLYLMRNALENYIKCAMCIPVYFEQAKPSVDRRRFRWTFDKWNQNPTVKIYRNKQIITSGLEVNYFKGEVVFDGQLLPQDIVHADYNFRWFSEEQLNSFLVNAVSVYNHYTPFTGYTIESLPVGAEPGVIYKAAADALRTLIGCLMFQQPQMIFGGAEEAARIRGDMETLKKNYESDWIRIFEQKKFRPYPKTWMILNPALPMIGGRSRWFRMLFTSSG